ncbi:MAG: hypothetical protein OES25_09520 [Acidobacteriota bacterium]|nr:hypothetical protein [Acidobacteriota bacterium]
MVSRWIRFAILMFVCTTSFAGGTSPRTLVYEVVYADGSGNERFRSDAVHWVRTELAKGGCFESIRERDDEPIEDGQLRLQIVLGYFDDEVSYDYSIAERFDPTAPPVDERRMGARQELDIGLNLFDDATETMLRYERRRIVTSHRPIITEDAREVSREEMVREVGRRTRLWLCRVSPAKLEKTITKALGSPDAR